MRFTLLFQILVLSAALVGVVFAIRNLNSNSMEKAFLAIGVEPGTNESPGLQPGSRPLQEGEERLNICRNRIHAVEFGSGQKVEEFKEGLKLRWLAFEEAKPRELGYLEVEKWLSRHCQIIVKPVEPKAIAAEPGTNPVLIRYIDRTELPVKRIGERYFEIDGRHYESEDFASALEELRQIAQFKSAPAK